MVLGRICIKHFKKTDFKRNDKHHVILKPNAIPSIFQNQNEFHGINTNNEVDQNEPLQQIELQPEECFQCTQKDEIIAKMEQIQSNKEKDMQHNQDHIETLKTEIQTLKLRLKKSLSRAYYLDSCKTKLNTTISLMKDQKLIDEKLLIAIEVGSNHFNS